MNEHKFIQIAIYTWIVGVTVALLLLLNDYSVFARARESGINDWTARIDDLDDVFREALRVESTLKIDYNVTENDLDVYSNELTKFSGIVSDFKTSYSTAGSSVFPKIFSQIEDIEKNLDKLQGRLSSLTSMAESMLGNTLQANDYRSQARLLRSEARRYDASWYWGNSYSLYSQAEAFEREARKFDDNASRVEASIGVKRAEIRSEIGGYRRKLSVAHAECEKAAEQSYVDYLKAKVSRFSKNNEQSIQNDTSRSKFMRKHMK